MLGLPAPNSGSPAGPAGARELLGQDCFTSPRGGTSSAARDGGAGPHTSSSFNLCCCHCSLAGELLLPDLSLLALKRLQLCNLGLPGSSKGISLLLLLQCPGSCFFLGS
jgi:hypothetical protein